MKYKLREEIKTTLLIGLTLLVWIPLWMILSGSLMGESEIVQNVGPVFNQSKGMADWTLFPQYLTMRPFVKLLFDSPNFFIMFWNSCIQVIPILIGQLLIATPAAWGFARYEFRGKNILFFLYIILMVLPFQVTMVSSYLVLYRFKLIDTHLSIILPNIFSAFPVFIMTKFFKTIPKSLIEAAKLDGANEGYLFLKVGIPLGKSGIFSALVLGFIEYWNAIEQPITFLVRKKNLWPLSLYISSITTEKIGVAFSASVIILIPTLLIFLYGQKYLEQGIAASGLKE
ncbi:carbohydrate ABC transporter permease [Anaeromicropila herbilytica]|uniref:Sugar ABC transporter permease n=1 Tax=Anaeromicropila herbilytica TaxID=2785025 RepID=A0A7R7EJ40_9FIRM|nr:carbohydrate ABC transporter permease [Anaeromicropila herbilytica]BCN29727.1 sugar ABC transporter permease [Anaeromicropila herbilytica]